MEQRTPNLLNHKTVLYLLLIIAFIYFTKQGLFAQNVGINSTGATAHPSALLDLDATASPSVGLLVPRISLSLTTLPAPVTGPANSLMVYNLATTTGTAGVSPGYYYWDATALKWIRMQTSATTASDWNLLGNAGTNSANHFLGTTDAQDLVFKTNGMEAMRTTTAGLVGIGTTTVLSKLHVSQGNILATNNAFCEIAARSYALGGSGVHAYFMGLAGSGTEASPGYPLIGRTLSAFIGRDVIDAYSAHQGGSSIYMRTTENFSATNKGSNLVFSTTANGTNTVTERMLIDHNGNVSLGVIPGSSTHLLNLNSNANNDGMYISSNGNGGEISFQDNSHFNLNNGRTTLPTISMPHYGLAVPSTTAGGAAGEMYISGYSGVSLFTSGNERMRVDVSGNVGIGTTTPSSKLHVAGDIFAQGGVIRSSVNGTSGVLGQLNLDGINSAAAEPNRRGWTIYNMNEYSTTYSGLVFWEYYDRNNNGLFCDDGPNDCLARMIIQNGTGNVGIGVSAPSQPLQMRSGAFCSAAGVWTNASDSRLKDNIKPSAYGLAEVMKLRPVTYTMKANGEKQIGFIAQEVKKIIPEVVSGKEGNVAKGETLGLSYGNMVALLTKAMQEQQVQIELLTKKTKQVDELQKQNESQQEQIDALKKLLQK